MADHTPARILPADAAAIAEAAKVLRLGALVAVPTETVYGLGGGGNVIVGSHAGSIAVPVRSG